MFKVLITVHATDNLCGNCPYHIEKKYGDESCILFGEDLLEKGRSDYYRGQPCSEAEAAWPSVSQ